MAQEFAAILLVCLAATPRVDCTEDNAGDVRSIVVASELGCAMGWQELIARSGEAQRSGDTTYLKTVCRRMGPGEER